MRVKPGRGSHFLLTVSYLSSFNYLAQRPIWRDVPVERLPAIREAHFCRRYLRERTAFAFARTGR